MRILVIDDSPLLRKRLIAKLSRDHGTEMVKGTGDPLEAIGLIRQERPDFVIMNRRMHRRYGIDILKSIKTMVPAPEVVMFTSRFHPTGGRKCPADGADSVLTRFTEIHAELTDPNPHKRDFESRLVDLIADRAKT